MIIQSQTVNKESHSDRFLKVQQKICAIKYASKNFCNQKVKIKKEMPDSTISISFNTANPFKLCHIKYLRRFREAFRLKHCLQQRVYVDYFRVKKNTDRSCDKYIGVPIFSASLFPATGFTHLSLPLGRLGCKGEHSQQLEKLLFSASTTHANKYFILDEKSGNNLTFSILR